MSLVRDFVAPGERHRYGRHPLQRAELRRPAGVDGRPPVCVLLHGGYWRWRWSRRYLRALSGVLARAGWATWNVEYRRVGMGFGGGWPQTFDDVAAAIDHLARWESDFDLDRVVAVGHSAGGELALWAARRPAPGVRVSAVAALAAVTNMEKGDVCRPGGGAYGLLGGTPEERPELYAEANPIRRVPIGVPLLVVHGAADETIPLARSREFAAAAREAGDEVELVELPGADHRAVADPRSPAIRPTLAWLEERRAGG